MSNPLKSIGKAVKKVFKGVGSFIKKIAPILIVAAIVVAAVYTGGAALGAAGAAGGAGTAGAGVVAGAGAGTAGGVAAGSATVAAGGAGAAAAGGAGAAAAGSGATIGGVSTALNTSAALNAVGAGSAATGMAGTGAAAGTSITAGAASSGAGAGVGALSSSNAWATAQAGSTATAGFTPTTSASSAVNTVSQTIAKAPEVHIATQQAATQQISPQLASQSSGMAQAEVDMLKTATPNMAGDVAKTTATEAGKGGVVDTLKAGASKAMNFAEDHPYLTGTMVQALGAWLAEEPEDPNRPPRSVFGVDPEGNQAQPGGGRVPYGQSVFASEEYQQLAQRQAPAPVTLPPVAQTKTRTDGLIDTGQPFQLQPAPQMQAGDLSQGLLGGVKATEVA